MNLTPEEITALINLKKFWENHKGQMELAFEGKFEPRTLLWDQTRINALEKVIHLAQSQAMIGSES